MQASFNSTIIVASSAYCRWVVPSGTRWEATGKIWQCWAALRRMREKASATKLKSTGEAGSPWRRPRPLTYGWGIGTFILFLFSAMVVSIVLLNFTPCNTGKYSFFDCSILNYFKNLSRYVFIEKLIKRLWSIYIDLDAQCVSSFTEVFLWKTPFKHSFVLSRKFYIISDQQYVIHIYRLHRKSV